jgi:putative membrane protein
MTQGVIPSAGPNSRREAISLFLKGWCMGMADLVPGVSGGTIAFISGIYEQLLDAIGSINRKSLSLLLTGQFKAAFSEIHFKFLLILFGAILSAIFTFARVMHYLMNQHTILTWSLFFGLISASIIVVFKELKNPKGLRELAWIFIGTVNGVALVSLIPVETPEHLSFIFLCGLISISAMILPGLSGSFLLLILGKYEYVTGAVKAPFAEGNFVVLLMFTMGAVTGAMGFSRVLNWFLKHYRCETMAFLTGILIGSMKKIWPWKEVLETRIISGRERVLREVNVLPELGAELYLAIFLMIFGFLGVLLLDHLSRQRKSARK